jgi:pseudaminic acid cytidylyltransferase
MNIAIIPARGGSKRIPRKNIKEFVGKPIIAYAINSAKQSKLFDHIIVSTEDEEIAQIAQSFGGEVPFMRPKELAGDATPTVPVIASAIENCRKLGWNFDNACCIYPCAPLIQTQDLVETFSYLGNSKKVFTFPIAEYPSPPQRAFRLFNDGKVNPIYSEYESSRSQDLEKLFFDTGQFYWGSAELWLTNPSIHKNGIGYVIPNWRAIDINSIEDWFRAELAYKIINNN